MDGQGGGEGGPKLKVSVSRQPSPPGPLGTATGRTSGISVNVHEPVGVSRCGDPYKEEVLYAHPLGSKIDEMEKQGYG